MSLFLLNGLQYFDKSILFAFPSFFLPFLVEWRIPLPVHGIQPRHGPTLDQKGFPGPRPPELELLKDISKVGQTVSTLDAVIREFRHTLSGWFIQLEDGGFQGTEEGGGIDAAGSKQVIEHYAVFDLLSTDN